MIETQLAGGIVRNDAGAIVLVQNGSSAFWGFPKGHIDPGEASLAAAKREIAEETGLTQLSLIKELPIYQRPRVMPGGADDPHERKTMHMYLFATGETTLQPTDPSNPEARWCSIKEAHALLTHPKDREYLTHIEPLLD